MSQAALPAVLWHCLSLWWRNAGDRGSQGGAGTDGVPLAASLRGGHEISAAAGSTWRGIDAAQGRGSGFSSAN